ncbi:MAG: ZIP family metal transporter [Candidatus Wildermuthbacteria bacterium]|nr:ZIP family metal transporter [Candidatus Wildermuthbacteria bacterium]
MSELAYILLFTFIGSIGALGGGMILFLKDEFSHKVSSYLTSFAAGTLLAVAFFDLLPEAFEGGAGVNVFAFTLGGLLMFFILERLIHTFHQHPREVHEHEKEAKATVPLIVIGDTVHNFIDGVVIAATFMVSIPLGIVTTLAVFAHEVPQEIGDFALLLHKGVSRRMVILINVLSAAAAFMGALLTYVFGNFLEGSIPMFLALTAGFFIYIATSDIMPEIQYERNRKAGLIKSAVLLLGVAALYIMLRLVAHPE